MRRGGQDKVRHPADQSPPSRSRLEEFKRKVKAHGRQSGAEHWMAKALSGEPGLGIFYQSRAEAR